MQCECLTPVSKWQWWNFGPISLLTQTNCSSLCLKQIISKAGNPAFDLFSQQDAAEILSYILEEFCGESVHASESIRIHIRQTIPAAHFNWRLIFYSPAACFRVDPEVPKLLLRIKFLEWRKWHFFRIRQRFTIWNGQKAID